MSIPNSRFFASLAGPRIAGHCPSSLLPSLNKGGGGKPQRQAFHFPTNEQPAPPCPTSLFFALDAYPSRRRFQGSPGGETLTKITRNERSGHTSHHDGFPKELPPTSNAMALSCISLKLRRRGERELGA